MHAADLAMYRAKGQDRSSLEFSHSETPIHDELLRQAPSYCDRFKVCFGSKAESGMAEPECPLSGPQALRRPGLGFNSSLRAVGDRIGWQA
jgi:hypothetical protein